MQKDSPGSPHASPITGSWQLRALLSPEREREKENLVALGYGWFCKWEGVRVKELSGVGVPCSGWGSTGWFVNLTQT